MTSLTFGVHEPREEEHGQEVRDWIHTGQKSDLSVGPIKHELHRGGDWTEGVPGAVLTERDNRKQEQDPVATFVNSNFRGNVAIFLVSFQQFFVRRERVVTLRSTGAI